MPFSAFQRLERTPSPRLFRTPEMRQGEHAECGLTALAILMGFHGVHLSMKALRRRAGSTLFGTTLRQMRDIARAEGFDATARRCEPADMERIGLPLIAHMRFIHFVVVEGFSKAGVHINDPASGPAVVSHAAFSRDFTGIALNIVPRSTIQRRGRTFSLIRSLARAPGPQRHRAVWRGLATALCLGAFAGAATAAALGQALLHPATPLAFLLPTLALLATAGLATFAAISCIERALSTAGGAMAGETIRSLRRASHTHFLVTRPERTKALFSAVRTLQQSPAPVGALALAAMGAGLATGTALAPMVVAPIAALSVMQGLVLFLAARRRGGAIARFGSGDMPVRGVDAAFLEDPGTARIGRGGDAVFARLAGLHALATADAVKAAEAHHAPQTLAFALDLAKCATPIVMLSHGLINPAEAGLALALAALCAPLVRTAAKGMHFAPLTNALLHLEDRPAPRMMLPAPHRRQPAPPGLRLRAAGWMAPGAERPVLDGLSLDLRPGQTLVVHAEPGRGATSFARLAAGLIEPSTGSVQRTGRAILVDHRVFIVPGTLRDNLKLGDPAIKDERMRVALEVVGLQSIVDERGGLAMVLKPDQPRLSGGQLRRLILARALCRAPRILVLDGALDAVETDLARDILIHLAALGLATVVTTRNHALADGADLILRLGGCP